MTARARFSIGIQNTQIRVAAWSDKYGPLALFNSAVIAAILQDNSSRLYIERLKVSLATQYAPCCYVVSVVSVEYAVTAERFFALDNTWHTNRDCNLISVIVEAANDFRGTVLMSKYIMSNGRGFQWVAACQNDLIKFDSGSLGRFFAVVISFPVDEAENLVNSNDANNPSVSLELFGEA